MQCYFFLGLGASQTGLLDYLGGVLFASGQVGKLIALGKASLRGVILTLPRYLPLRYRLRTPPVLLRSSTTVYSAWERRYPLPGCSTYEFK